VQKIWLRGEFDATHAIAEDGRPLQILHPGRGICSGGRLSSRQDPARRADLDGDVELHLYADALGAHGARVRWAYDRVVLHVVLFPLHLVRRGGPTQPNSHAVLLPLLLTTSRVCSEDRWKGLPAAPTGGSPKSCVPAARRNAALLEKQRNSAGARRRVSRDVELSGWLSEACHPRDSKSWISLQPVADAEDRHPRATRGVGGGNS